GHSFEHLHVWPRDRCEPGHRGFVPGPTDHSNEVGQAILEQAVDLQILPSTTRVNAVVKSNQLVLDVIVVEENQWWFGTHIASSRILRHPGGTFRLQLPEHAVSRAYMKMNEALAWSRLPIAEGDRIVEIGSAPGGACQALLERGLLVTGVDPSDMHEAVASHANFTHIKKRGADLKRKEYSDFKWLVVDTNVAPTHTLDTVDAIVNHDRTNIRGMLLTLKLPEWKLTDQVPEYLDRIRSWGYGDVRARQLANNRQEICVAVLRSKAKRRLAKSKRKQHAKSNQQTKTDKKPVEKPVESLGE
ncbi:MAG: hypothetical protein KDB27_15885, partial [Planctomycetales bacterium]|nr:hypothetical protein [Planctomycetales bacterium]